MKHQLTLLLCASVALISCSDTSDAEGTISVTAYGESFIEEGIPASKMNDDWEISFEAFDVTFSQVSVADQDLEGVELDLAESSDGAGHVLDTLAVTSGNYADAEFAIDRVEIRGTATLEDTEKSFHWVFDTSTLYSKCETTTSVARDEEAVFQITVHADHLFYDSLVAEEPQLLFGALASADADDDGEITEAELSMADIGGYDAGSDDGVDTLWEFLSAQVRTLGHVDGEGHCHSEVVK